MKNIGNNSKRIPAESTPSVKDLFGKAADVLASAMGQVQTTGTVGSFLSFNESPPYVYTFYYYQGPKDLARFGAPLYETAQLSTLSGFVLCENASVNFSNGHPTEPEAAAVMSALDSGVFLE